MTTYNRDVLNKPGHNAGHKADHLSEWNRKRNALFAIELDPEKRGDRNGKEARRIASEMLGRDILPSEHVHHIDGNPGNNSKDNLAVMDKHDHLRLHAAVARDRMNRGVAQ